MASHQLDGSRFAAGSAARSGQKPLHTLHSRGMRCLANRARLPQVLLPISRFGILLENRIFFRHAGNVDGLAHNCGGGEGLDLFCIQILCFRSRRQDSEYGKAGWHTDNPCELPAAHSLKGVAQSRCQLRGTQPSDIPAILRTRINGFFFGQHTKVHACLELVQDGLSFLCGARDDHACVDFWRGLGLLRARRRQEESAGADHEPERRYGYIPLRHAHPIPAGEHGPPLPITSKGSSSFSPTLIVSGLLGELEARTAASLASANRRCSKREALAESCLPVHFRRSPFFSNYDSRL